jgi:predicted transposase/invertase (TIGR01784 family)
LGLGAVRQGLYSHAATYVLAGLKLEADVISQVIRRDVMQESVTYQAILAEGEQIGIERGREKGREEGRETAQRSIARQLLRAQISIEVILKVTGLSMEQLDALRVE